MASMDYGKAVEHRRRSLRKPHGDDSYRWVHGNSALCTEDDTQRTQQIHRGHRSLCDGWLVSLEEAANFDSSSQRTSGTEEHTPFVRAAFSATRTTAAIPNCCPSYTQPQQKAIQESIHNFSTR